MADQRDYPIFVLHIQTDTAHPQDIVPIYLVHTLENPFCPSSGCWCKTNQEEIAKLLEYVKNGEMTLKEAAQFADGRTV